MVPRRKGNVGAGNGGGCRRHDLQHSATLRAEETGNLGRGIGLQRPLSGTSLGIAGSVAELRHDKPINAADDGPVRPRRCRCDTIRRPAHRMPKGKGALLGMSPIGTQAFLWKWVFLSARGRRIVESSCRRNGSREVSRTETRRKRGRVVPLAAVGG